MDSSANDAPRIQIKKNGPYLVSGAVALSREAIGCNAAGESVEWVRRPGPAAQASYALCRCGHSANKPFCDGTHAKVRFDGTETADRRPYLEQAQRTAGPAMSLTDTRALCAGARFCDPNGGVWRLVKRTDDPVAREQFTRQCGACPSGRLVAWDESSGKAVEPDFAPAIVLIDDPARHCAGPLAVRGGVQLVSADGFLYERRNRVTLCRCGASRNKPFCDGSHETIGFTDGA